MSVIIRLQGLSWSASAMDIRNFFKGLSIPPGGVHIIGGERGDAFIAFSTDEDARRAMLMNNGKLNDAPIMLFLSSKTEMQNTIQEAKERHSVPAPVSAVAPPTAPAPVSSAPAFSQMSQQLPVNTQTQIPGLGMPQVQIPQISQLSQFLSGLLPNSNLTSSVVGKFLNQHPQQPPQQQSIVQPHQVSQQQIKSPIQDNANNSPYQNPYEQSLPGEYSVGGISQAKQTTSNYMNQFGQNENHKMSVYGVNDRRNEIPQNIVPPNVIPSSKADMGIFHGHVISDPRPNPKPFQSPSDSQQSWSSERNEPFAYGDLNRQRELDASSKSKVDQSQKPRNSRWSDQGDFNYNDRNWTARDNSQDNWNKNSMSNWNDDWNKQKDPNSMYDVGNKWNQINNDNSLRNYDGNKWVPENNGGQNFDKMKGFPEKNESFVPQIPKSTINYKEDRWSPQKTDRNRFDQVKDTPKSQERFIPTTSVPTSAYDPKSLSPKTTPAGKTHAPSEASQKPQIGSIVKPEVMPSKESDNLATRKPNFDDEDMEIDEFGRMRRKRQDESKAGSPASYRDKRDSREKSRERDRSRHHDSPRRDRDRERDRDRRDRDRDRDRRDRDRRDRDRDRRNRDRDDDRRDRRRDQDRRSSPGSSEGNRRSRKRSLSPNSKMENETDKKLQQEKPGVKPEGLASGPNAKMLPPFASNQPQTKSASTVQKDTEEDPNTRPPGPAPLFPIIPRRGNGAGILGAAPPGFLNAETKVNDGTHIKNSVQEPIKDPNIRHPDEFVSDEIMMAEADAIYQQQIEEGRLRGFEPGHPPMNRGPRDIHDRGSRNFDGSSMIEGSRPPFRGGPSDIRREGPMFSQHPHERPGLPEFDRGPLIREQPPPQRGHFLDKPQDMNIMPMESREPNERLDRRPDGPPPLLPEPLLQQPPIDIRQSERHHTHEYDNRRDMPRDLPPHLREEPIDPRRPLETFREPGEMRGPPEHFRGHPDDFRGPHPDIPDRLMGPGPEDREFEFRRIDRPHDRPMFERGGPPEMPIEGPRPPFGNHGRPLLDERGLPNRHDMRLPFDQHERPLLDERGLPFDHPGPRERPLPPNMHDRPPFNPDIRGPDAPDLERHHSGRRRPLLEDPVLSDNRPPGNLGMMGPRPHDRSDFVDLSLSERQEFHSRGHLRDRPQRDTPDRIMERSPRDASDRTIVDREQEFIRRPLLNTPDLPARLPPEHEERMETDRRHERGRDFRGHPRFDGRESRNNSGGRQEMRDDRQGKPPSLLDLKSPASQHEDRERVSNRPSRFDQPRERESNREKTNSRQHSSSRSEANKAKSVDNNDSKGSARKEQKDSSNNADGEYYVHISNLPINSNHGDVKKFLKDCAIHRKGIKIINDINGKRTGQAMVRFINKSSLNSALKLSGFVLEKKIVAVEELKKEKFDATIDMYEPGDEVVESDRERSKKIDMCNTLTATLMNLSGGKSNLSMPGGNNQINSADKSDSREDFIVKVENLAGITSVNDIRNLFRDCDLVKRDNAILLSGVIKGLRHCFVEFQNEKSVKTALRVRKIFRGNVITISQSSKQEREETKEPSRAKENVVVPEKKVDIVKPNPRGNQDNSVNDRNKVSAGMKKKDGVGDTNKDIIVDKNKDSLSDKIKESVDVIDKSKGSELGKEYHCIRITNLPYDFNYHDFRRLLDGLFIAPRGIQVCHDAVGQTLGEGCVELRDNVEAKKAMEKDGLILGRNKIRVEVITKQALIDHMRHSRQALRPELASHPQVFYYVKAANLPMNVSTGEIINFFSGYSPAPESIRLNVGDMVPNQNFSTALIGFKKKDDAERAVSNINRKLLRGKPVDLEKVIL